MKEELKKSLRTYGALLLLGVTGVPLGAAVGLIEALFCRLLLKVTAVRVAHLSCDRGSQSEIRWQGKRRHESDF